ncbi:MAG: hypothetical protein JWP47_983 [Polaromonas sp.]|nr:hypothetical protein [Polaromonas sp.]
MNRSSQRLQWDIFCRVIDNFGDIGVCWRLAADLAGRGHRVRLWVDDAAALAWMAPNGCAGATVLGWPDSADSPALAMLKASPCDVMIEAFGCEIASAFIAACASVHWAGGPKPQWINLEYLSAEAYVERCHGLPSPVRSGPGAGWTKFFFYPGFTTSTGGLLREPGLAARQAAFDRDRWLAEQGLPASVESGEKLVLLFCYEPIALGALMRQFMCEGLGGQPVRLLVAAGRPAQAVKSVLADLQITNNDQKCLQPIGYGGSMLSISYLPLLSQHGFDHALWAADLNLVRGEDSVVRALWAGTPLVWQIYPQEDGVHSAKLDAFLDAIDAPGSLRRFHHLWNASGSAEPSLSDADDPRPTAALIDSNALQAWTAHAQTARLRLLQQLDLASQLTSFVEKNR